VDKARSEVERCAQEVANSSGGSSFGDLVSGIPYVGGFLGGLFSNGKKKRQEVLYIACFALCLVYVLVIIRCR
jgi:hypothetical protein